MKIHIYTLYGKHAIASEGVEVSSSADNIQEPVVVDIDEATGKNFLADPSKFKTVVDKKGGISLVKK